MKTMLHGLAAALALLLIASFWTSTVISELFLSQASVAAVKQAIVYAFWGLIPALAVTGASGFALGKGRGGRLVSAKARRMPVIALNGLLVLLPSAFYLNAKAQAGEFDALFYGVQALELLAGAINLTLMGLNLRDGLRLAGRSPARLREEGSA